MRLLRRNETTEKRELEHARIHWQIPLYAVKAFRFRAFRISRAVIYDPLREASRESRPF